MIRKSIFILVALAIMATPAFAGNRPEFDAVGCDVENIFIGWVEAMVIEKGIYDVLDPESVLINEHSCFVEEDFETTGEQLRTDPCFGIDTALKYGDHASYKSSLTPGIWHSVERKYLWKIVLQMQPETDLDLDIRDCITKHNTFDIFNEANQTGRFTDPSGKLVFRVCSAQPLLTVMAIPGKFAHPYWKEEYAEHMKPVILKARAMPGGHKGFKSIDLWEVPYTSKALWEDGIVIELPTTGCKDREAKPMYNLRSGDTIIVKVTIPGHNPVDIFYGQDNVLLRYVGVIGTEYIGEDCETSEVCVANK